MEVSEGFITATMFVLVCIVGLIGIIAAHWPSKKK